MFSIKNNLDFGMLWVFSNNKILINGNKCCIWLKNKKKMLYWYGIKIVRVVIVVM